MKAPDVWSPVSLTENHWWRGGLKQGVKCEKDDRSVYEVVRRLLESG